MIYEIFAIASVNGLTWIEFAGCFTAAICGIYILLWILGWVSCQGHKYIFEPKDKSQEINNFMFRLLDVFDSSKETLPDGNYKSADLGYSSFWQYLKVKDNEIISTFDYSPKTIANVPNNLRSFKVPKNTAVSIRYNRPIDEKLWGFRSCTPVEVSLVLLPLVISLCVLFIDIQPLAALILGGFYLTLRIARGIVRLQKKLVSHIEDKGVHKE